MGNISTVEESVRIGLILPNEVDIAVQQIQLDYRREGKGKPSKRDVCLQLIEEALEARKINDDR